MIKQLNKLINVLKISNLTLEPSVDRELVLIKVKAPTSSWAEIQQIVETFRAKIIDVSLDSLIIEVTGNEENCKQLSFCFPTTVYWNWSGRGRWHCSGVQKPYKTGR